MLLLLLLAELLLILGDHLVKALGLLLSSALLALLGRYELGGLVLALDLLDAGNTIDVVELIAHVIGVVIHHVLKSGREVVVVLIILIIRLVVVGVGENVVSGEVNAVGARDDEEDLLSLGDDDV